MLYSLLLNLCFAQEPTDKKNVETQNSETEIATDIPVIHSGLDAPMALTQVSAASKHSMDSLKSLTIVDLIATSPISILEGGSLTSCSAAPMSNARLKKLSQEIDHALAYYDLEKADQIFQSAEKGLPCLRDPLDPETVSHLFFLEGILRHNNGEVEKSKNAYANAVRFNPAIYWDDMFAPDSKEFFDQAKSEFSDLKEIPLEVYPKNAVSSLWINGIPYSEGETPTVYLGDNIIQVLGSQVQNATLHVSKDAEKAVLVLPSTVAPTAHSWASDSSKQAELSIILQGILEEGEQIYFYHSGEVWTIKVGENGDTGWKKLEIPRAALLMGANTKKTIGKGLFWTGTVLTAGGSLYSGAKAVEAYGVLGDGEAAESFDVYEAKQTEYETIEDQYQVSWIITGVGLGFAGLGYWMQQ